MDDSIDDSQLRPILFQQIDKDSLSRQVSEVDIWLTDKHSHVFHQVTQRYSYLRQFAPALLEAVELQSDSDVESSVIKAVALLRKMNQERCEILLKRTVLSANGIGSVPC